MKFEFLRFSHIKLGSRIRGKTQLVGGVGGYQISKESKLEQPDHKIEKYIFPEKKKRKRNTLIAQLSLKTDAQATQLDRTTPTEAKPPFLERENSLHTVYIHIYTERNLCGAIYYRA